MSPVSAPPSKLMLAPPATSVKLPVMFGPNITGDYQALSAVNWQQANGAFYIDGEHGAIAQGIESQTSLSHMRFTASRLSAVFGNSQTVQPLSIRLLPCIKS